MPDRSDVELMLALKAGDEGAFPVLVQRHMTAVLNLAYRYVGNRADADDLAQEIFLKVHRARTRWRPEAKFTTWLYRIAANACLNELRNRKHRPTHGAAALAEGSGHPWLGSQGVDGADVEPHAGAERAELHAQVRAAVDALPERQRLALLLNKFHGLGYEEVAGALEMSVPAAKSLLVRAREGVRAKIEPYLEADKPRVTEKRGLR